MLLPVAWERRLHELLRRRSDSRRTSVPPHLLTGERGEDAAFFHLRERGYTVVARRWKANGLRGDLDLVAWHNGTLIFVEVKTRTAHDMAPAETAVDPAKQKMLRRMAAAFIGQYPERHRREIAVRFDVLAVYLIGSAPEYEHFENAFPRRDTSGWR